ncbi:hypothetical protein J2Y40_003670 [Chryseobacterium sp. 2987]|nr:hypothetical protein [Chryseobacterium sp. 2987]
MNNFITDKYLQQNILIFNQLDDFEKTQVKFPPGLFGILKKKSERRLF